VSKCRYILELAIGTGTHTLHLANTLVQQGSTFVCTEISMKMLEMARDKFVGDKLRTERHIEFKLDEELLDGSK
jgi:ubiquinone/menaquinone biosynthesis C-methylase UbiE